MAAGSTAFCADGAHPRSARTENTQSGMLPSLGFLQAMALRMLPVNLPETLTDAHALASTLLNACGDQATSPLAPPLIDAHLKLVSIGGIYGATELYMLTDR